MAWVISARPSIAQIKAWAPTAAHYILSAVMSQGGYLVVMGLLIHYRPPEDVAWVTLSYSLIMWLSILASWGMRQSYAIWCMKRPLAERAVFTLHAARQLLVVAVPTLVLVTSAVVWYVPAYTQMVIWAAGGALVSMLSELYIQYCMYTHQVGRYAWAKGGQAVLWMFFFAIALWCNGTGITCIQAYIAATLWTVLMGFVHLVQIAGADYSGHQTPRLVQWWYLGLQYIPTLLAAGAVAYSSRWLLLRAGLLPEIAYWAIIEYIGPLFQATVLQVINGVYWPLFMGYYQTNEQMAEQRAWTIILICVGVLGVGGALGWWCASIIARCILPVAYHGALSHGYLMIASYIIHTVSYLLMPRLHVREQLWPISVSLVIGCIVQITYGYYMVESQGMYGCVFALLGGQVIYLSTLMLLRSWVIRRPVL